MKRKAKKWADETPNPKGLPAHAKRKKRKGNPMKGAMHK